MNENFKNKEKIFYKYVNLDKEYALNILKGELYFSYPNQFNDPFDCKIEYKEDMSKEELLITYKKACERNNKKFDEQKIKNLSQEEIKNILKQMNCSGQTNALKIFCVSECCNNILMWSHYANKHTGICVGIKSEEINSKYIIQGKSGLPPANLIHLQKCEYNENIPAPCDLFADKEDLFPFMSTKYEIWEYEHEYRAIIAAQDFTENTVKIEKSNISEIILGINISKENRNKVINCIYKEFKDITKPTLYQCVYARGKYALNLVEIFY